MQFQIDDKKSKLTAGSPAEDRGQAIGVNALFETSIQEQHPLSERKRNKITVIGGLPEYDRLEVRSDV